MSGRTERAQARLPRSLPLGGASGSDGRVAIRIGPVSGPSRRSFLKTGSAAALALSIPAQARRVLAGARPRVGIVGGGLAGVSCAWLLAGVADAVLCESRVTLGGHAQSIAVTVGDQEIQVDVGAQFFAAETHPTYTKL